MAAVTAATSAIGQAPAGLGGTPPPKPGMRIDSAPTSARRATYTARTATSTARIRVRSRRESTQRSNHRRGR